MVSLGCANFEGSMTAFMVDGGLHRLTIAQLESTEQEKKILQLPLAFQQRWSA